MDGVPFLAKWVFGPSDRISWPIWRRSRSRMSLGPKRKLSRRAVMPAAAVRTVM